MANYYKRILHNEFNRKLVPNKVLLLLGARRVGKTEFINTFLSQTEDNYLHLNGEDINELNF